MLNMEQSLACEHRQIHLNRLPIAFFVRVSSVLDWYLSEIKK